MKKFIKIYLLIAFKQIFGMDACESLGDFETLYPPRSISEGAEITRIAPSPTGFPHIGTALQMVLNSAIAKKNDSGSFMVRIEDTDRSRTVEGSIESVFSSARWLGMSPDESIEFPGLYGPYIQSQRLKIYKAAADHLVSSDLAYPCFCSSERLEEIRLSMAQQKLPPKYDGFCSRMDKEHVRALLISQQPHVIRLKMPAGRKIEVSDLGRGIISFDSDNLDDFIILKTDGYPTYHLASIVDDHFMRVTTVIRGDEWMSSAPKHVLLYDYFGWTPPKFMHTPVIRDQDKKKLSKRKGDTSIDWIRSQGFLPEAFSNFLTRLIWQHPENKDVYPFSDVVEHMSLSDLSITGPVMDYNIFFHINSSYLLQQSSELKTQRLIEYIEFLKGKNDDIEIIQLVKGESSQVLTKEFIFNFFGSFSQDFLYSTRVVSVVGERMKRLSHIFLYSYFFNHYSPPRLTSLGIDGASELLGGLDIDLLFSLPAGEKEVFLREYSVACGVKPSVTFSILRQVITNEKNTPNILDVIDVLGIQEVKRRVMDAF